MSWEPMDFPFDFFSANRQPTVFDRTNWRLPLAGFVTWRGTEARCVASKTAF